MAARVGTGVEGSGSTVSSVSTPAKSTTTGNLNVVFVKWENGSSALAATPITDTASNTYTQVGSTLSHSVGGEPFCAMFYCANATGNANNVFTVTFTGSANTFIHILAEEWSGIATSSVTDGSPTTTDNGNSATYTTGDITTSTPGLVIMGVAGYTTLSSLSGVAGNPDFSIGVAGTDTFFAYLLSGSAQTVSPGASDTASDRWLAMSQAFKDAAAGPGPTVAWLTA